jgi:hypothetical protein
MTMRIHRGALAVAAVAALVASAGSPLLLTSMRLKLWHMPRKPWRMGNKGMPMPWCSMLRKH